MIKHLTSENFDEIVLKSEVPVLVDFWAAWCGPCRRMAPILEDLALEIGDKAVIAKLEVDEEPEIADAFQIVSIPTLIVFKNGEVVKQLVGLHSKDALKQQLGL
ncbi:MAG: thioredoxin [Acholeplasmataceae bacterium]